MSDKNEWGSNLSFVLAMVGSAVGLGNIWRYFQRQLEKYIRIMNF